MIPNIGQPLDRVDGRLKVTGGARYAMENKLANVAYGVLVSSTIPSGAATGTVSSICRSREKPRVARRFLTRREV